jgi:dienelactone hydrolase
MSVNYRAAIGLLALCVAMTGQTPQRVNQVGAYGPWLADQVLGDGPARCRFARASGRTSPNGAKPRAACARNHCSRRPRGKPTVTVTGRTTYDGLDIEFLTWQLPAGPKTEAVFLKAIRSAWAAPGILALHDHGGNKFLGWRKIVRTDDTPWAVQEKHQANYYGGVGWANEIAKRGYAVLVHDTFPFASRRVMVKDVPPRIQAGGVDPSPDDAEGIAKYNAFAGAHENVMEKSLLSAGTTWPGVYLVEDQRALDVLAGRPEVDASRIGIAGLSGGGMRTVFLGGLDDRVKVAVAVGFMTTWRDFLLDKAFTHTWMTYVPLLAEGFGFPRDPGVAGSRGNHGAQLPQDPLYTLSEMQRADAMMPRLTSAQTRRTDTALSIMMGATSSIARCRKDAFDWFDGS